LKIPVTVSIWQALNWSTKNWLTNNWLTNINGNNSFAKIILQEIGEGKEGLRRDV
jgi:hypothetical protein